MTAQIEDTTIFGDREYAIVGVKRTDGPAHLFDPTDHGLAPRPMSTACHRGFFCKYAIEDDRLVLCDLSIWLGAGPYGTGEGDLPLLFGKYPVYSPEEWFHVYRDLNAPLALSGGILLGADFIEELYTHRGPQAPHTYRTVHELIFEQGLLVQHTDRSEDMARVRGERGMGEPRPSQPRITD